MENIILSVITPFVIPAMGINVVLDVLKKYLPYKPIWLLPTLCVVLSAVIPAVYAFLPLPSKPEDILTQIFGVMSLSYFFYDAGGYSFLKNKLIRRGVNDVKHSDKR